MIDTTERNPAAGVRVRNQRCVEAPTSRVERAESGDDRVEIQIIDASFDMVRQFAHHLAAVWTFDVDHDRTIPPVDWDALRAMVVDSCSIEQAIGRAVVITDQIRRGTFDDPTIANRLVAAEHEDSQFFGFSVADAIPDFGDHSRYRTRVARRLTGIFGSAERS